MSVLNDRIKKARADSGLTLEEVSIKVGVSRQTIQKYESGIISNIPSDKIEKIAGVLNVSPAYLMGWEDKHAANAETLIKSIPNLMPLPYTVGHSVPLIGTIACGTPILTEENMELKIPLPDHISADFCLRCKGDSMINARIFDGDIVYVRQQPTVENGEIAAVLIDDMADTAEATLKRVYIYEDKIMLNAENPMYSPFVYVGEEMNKVRIIGKAVAFLSGIK